MGVPYQNKEGISKTYSSRVFIWIMHSLMQQQNLWLRILYLYSFCLLWNENKWHELFTTTNNFKLFTTKRLTKLSVRLTYGFLHARKLFIEDQDGSCNYYVCFKEILIIEKFTKILNETRQNKKRRPLHRSR